MDEAGIGNTTGKSLYSNNQEKITLNTNSNNTSKALVCFIILSFFLFIYNAKIFYLHKEEVIEWFNSVIEGNALINQELAQQRDQYNSLQKSLEERITQKDLEIAELQEEIELLETQVIELGTKIQGPSYAPGTLNKASGVAYYDGHRETWYNLDMNTVVAIAHSRGIEGEYWIREDGAKMLGEFIMIAADQNVHPYGSYVDVSMGTGVVVDSGSFIYSDPYQIDVAVNW